jgi:hypothetical protein
MIVLPETTAKGARRVARKLERLFEMHSLSTPADPIGLNAELYAHWARGEGGPLMTLCLEISPTFARDRTLVVGAYEQPGHVGRREFPLTGLDAAPRKNEIN